MPSCIRLNIPAESQCREGHSRFIVDSTCGQALVPPSTVRFAPLMYGRLRTGTLGEESGLRPWLMTRFSYAIVRTTLPKGRPSTR